MAELRKKMKLKSVIHLQKNDKIIRTDIFSRTIKGKKDKVEYYAVPIYRMDYALGILPNNACPTSVTNSKTKNLTEWIPMDSNYTFCFSLFTNDLVCVKKKKTDKKGMENPVIGYYEGINPSNSSITIAKHDNYSQKEDLSDLSSDEREIFKRKVDKKTGKIEIIGEGVGIRNLEIFEKWQVSPLGEVKKAKFKKRENISLKSTPKTAKHSMPNSNLETQ